MEDNNNNNTDDDDDNVMYFFIFYNPQSKNKIKPKSLLKNKDTFLYQFK